jgi:hypothetical protein
VAMIRIASGEQLCIARKVAFELLAAYAVSP